MNHFISTDLNLFCQFPHRLQFHRARLTSRDVRPATKVAKEMFNLPRNGGFVFCFVFFFPFFGFCCCCFFGISFYYLRIERLLNPILIRCCCFLVLITSFSINVCANYTDRAGKMSDTVGR